MGIMFKNYIRTTYRLIPLAGLVLAGCQSPPPPAMHNAPLDLPPAYQQQSQLPAVQPVQQPIQQPQQQLYRAHNALEINFEEVQPATGATKTKSGGNIILRRSGEQAKLGYQGPSAEEIKADIEQSMAARIADLEAKLRTFTTNHTQMTRSQLLETQQQLKDTLAEVEERSKRYAAERAQLSTLQMAGLVKQQATEQSQALQKAQMAVATVAERAAKASIEGEKALLAAQAYTDQQLADMQAFATQMVQNNIAATESRLRTFAEAEISELTSDTQAQLAEQKNLTVETARSEAERLASQKAQEVEARLRQLTEEKAAQALAASTAAMSDVASKTLVQAQADLQQLAAAARPNDDEIRVIAAEVMADSSDQIRALAMQTLAESDDYIRTVAREAIKQDDPGMRAALAQVARQVILDENDNVTFAIRQVVSETVSEQQQMMAENEINTDNLNVAKLVPPDLDLASIEPAAGPLPHVAGDWVNIRDYKVIVHENDAPLAEILKNVLDSAEPYTGPWHIKWKLTRENQDIKTQNFSLDAETSFEKFVNYLAQYIFNTRGVQVTFNMFDAERMMVVSDE